MDKEVNVPVDFSEYCLIALDESPKSSVDAAAWSDEDWACMHSIQGFAQYELEKILKGIPLEVNTPEKQQGTQLF